MKKASKVSPSPKFPAKELQSWFRSEVKQLTDSVHHLEKDFERITGQTDVMKRPRTRATAHPANKTAAARRTARSKPGTGSRPARKVS